VKVRTLPPVWGITVVRVVAGLIIFLAGLEKLTGGFDGFTKSATNLGLPAPELWGVFIPLLETIGGALILVGLGARWLAILFVVEYAVTTFVLKAQRPPPFGGWNSLRIDLMLFSAAVTLVLVGPGALALESLLARSRRGVEGLAHPSPPALSQR
jgi:putative oxidoreductase